jgi:hypothetical protein
VLIVSFIIYFFSTNNSFKINKYFYQVEPDEIKRLGKRFRKLDLDGSGALSIDEFMSIPELQQNPLVQRVIDIFDADSNGEVDFRGNRSLNIPDMRTMLIYLFNILSMKNLLKEFLVSASKATRIVN